MVDVASVASLKVVTPSTSNDPFNVVSPSTFNAESKSTSPVACTVPVISN